MIRFIKHSVDSIDGIALYPIISLVLFFAIFVIMLVMVFGYKKKYIDNMSNIPLEEDEYNLNNE